MVTRRLFSGTYVQNPLAAGVHFPMAAARGSFGGDKKRRRKNQMVIKNVGTRGHQLLPLFIALALALTIGASKANAQITGDLEVKIPFQFHAGNTKLPAGEYRIHVLDDSDLAVMEISSADGSISALFQVRESEANSAPAKNELIFNKYGNRYFLAELYEEGNASGSQVAESGYEKALSKETAEAQEHVPARRGMQQGK
jgi:hypothetical protein